MSDQKPIVIFDLETTGTDVSKDRIVEFAAIKVFSHPIGAPEPGDGEDGGSETLNFRCNPGIPIPKEVQEIIGITDEDVANEPKFDAWVNDVLEFMEGADLCGYNIANFDVPLLWEEIYRALKHPWNLERVRIFDVCSMYKKLNPRTLSAAFKQYTGKELEGAHGALVDASATADVLHAMIHAHPDIAIMSEDQLAAYCAMDSRVDLAGKILRDEKGRPCFAQGKNKGQPLENHPDYVAWMLGAEFPVQTKMTLKRLGYSERVFGRRP